MQIKENAQCMKPCSVNKLASVKEGHGRYKNDGPKCTASDGAMINRSKTRCAVTCKCGRSKKRNVDGLESR